VAPTVTPTVAPTVAPAATSPPVAAAGPARQATIRVPRQQGAAALTVERTLTLPEGFEIAVFAPGLARARFMAWSPEGDLLISETVQTNGKVYVLPDRDRDGLADDRVVFAQGLRSPHGLAFYQHYLYVAEETRVVRFVWQGGQPAAGPPEVIVDRLPGGGHITRTIGFGPDGKLYLAVGSSCNVCVEADQRRAAITQYNPDGSGGRLYARGLRNAVGMAVHPETKEIWVSQHERDMIEPDHQDLPPEEINILRDGGDYGWPYCHSDRVPNPEFNDAQRCANTIPPALTIQAHSGPLGLTFLDKASNFPEEYRDDALLALHGSWNRDEPTGAKVVRIHVEDGKPTKYEDFVTGWQRPDGSRWGRPVDVLVYKDGSVLISVDAGSAIYRVIHP
jgi:glucose/arabinose dehydrogenase